MSCPNSHIYMYLWTKIWCCFSNMCDKQNAVTHAIIELYVNLSALQVAQQSLSTSK